MIINITVNRRRCAVFGPKSCCGANALCLIKRTLWLGKHFNDLFLRAALPQPLARRRVEAGRLQQCTVTALCNKVSARSPKPFKPSVRVCVCVCVYGRRLGRVVATGRNFTFAGVAFVRHCWTPVKLQKPIILRVSTGFWVGGEAGEPGFEN